jgi:hypothetical protein
LPFSFTDVHLHVPNYLPLQRNTSYDRSLEMELCDAPPLLLFSHSLGGGTGSGLGTRLCEEAADEVGYNYIITLNICTYDITAVD